MRNAVFDVTGTNGSSGSSGGATHCASSSDTIESLAVLRLTDSPRRQRASPGMASGPKWPWPGTRLMKDLVKGSYLRWGPRKQTALFVEPCEMKSWFSAAFMSSP
jgi:hypothetical protein